MAPGTIPAPGNPRQFREPGAGRWGALSFLHLPPPEDGRDIKSDISFLVTADDKPLVWLGGAVKSPPFSSEARLEAGFLLRRLQAGENLGMPQSRPMPSIGRGCHELRIADDASTWRLVYFIDRDAIVILAVFSKKTRATPKQVVAVCQTRLRAYRDARSRGGDDG
jgi:phage-related protein